MKSQEYLRESLRTEAPITKELKDRLKSNDTIRLIHSGMGLSTEVGEFQDALKKFVFYGKEVDKTNLEEEMGDLLWYISIACDVLDCTLSHIMKQNIEKLKSRFPSRFAEKEALNRNLTKERKILEGGKSEYI